MLIADYAFLSEVPESHSLEGYLFPDTYEVWEDQLPEGLIRKQLRTFANKVIIPLEEQRAASGLSWHEVVTLASIVEAEVRTPKTRKVVAGIFLNRLNDGMRLQSDATLNYIIDEGRDRATQQDLKLDSPYNTYRLEGLPPGPVGNPGLSSIEAVLNPTPTEYYFFLTDESGNVYYAETFEGHQRNRQEAFGS
ncbi:endolytic transglycosylase MltG [Candidatus Uhrbacteria bacterium]|nr:endolytic transglycosylase MltG [Candidatus Uhrbacteria bacterium]